MRVFLRDAIFHKMSHADWNAIIDVHLNGYFYVAKAAAPHFKAQNSGAFVHFTSTSGLIGNVGSGQLLRGQGRGDRALNVNRAGHAALRSAFELHRPPSPGAV